MEKEKKILKFHFEEIIFILLILSTDLTAYDKDELKTFAEAIHRLDCLFNETFLMRLKTIGFEIDDVEMQKFIVLKSKVQQMYSSHWYEKLTIETDELIEIKKISRYLLAKTKIEYIEPLEYAENHMDVDW
jgi:hypothetical protein